MKIAFVSDAVAPWSVGGIDSLVGTEAEALAKHHEVHFFTFRWPGMKKDFVKKGIRYHTSHEMNTKRFYRHGRRSIRESIVFMIQIARIFRHRFDVVQANEFPVIHLPLLKFYCKVTGARLIIDIHEVWDKSYWYDYLGGFIGFFADKIASFSIKGADAYLANSSITAERLGRFGIPKSRIFEFSPIIDDSMMRGLENLKRKKEVIFAGRLIKEKRIDKWLGAIKDAMKMTKLNGAIIGEGPEEHEIRALIRQMELEKIVEFRHFYKDKRAMYRRIASASVLLHMGEREGLSIIAIESIALGTPVIIPDYSPIPEEVRKMCIVRSEKEIPRAIVDILNGKIVPERNKYGIKRFYISNIAEFYETLFRKIA
jgi:glycosyltransferase involved in cell wall biosynthesis